MKLLTLPLLALIVTQATTGCSLYKKDHDEKPAVVVPLLDPHAPCPQGLQNQFLNIRAAQDKWYLDHGSPVPTEIDKAQLHIGTNGRAVMVVHGFISAPAAMMDVADELIKDGDTVYVPLLTGWGSDAHAANAASTDDWRQSISDGVAMLKLCYPDVAVVAHSLGGAIVTDEIVNHNLQGVNNLTLLSPYYKLEQPWPQILIQAMAGGLDDINVTDLQKDTGVDPYSYLPLQKPKPGEPAPFLPLRALAKVVDLQGTFDKGPAAPNDTPVLLVESEADPVINGGFAATYLSSFTKDLERVTYEKSENIGHSVETRNLNPHFDDMMKAMQAQIEKNK